MPALGEMAQIRELEFCDLRQEARDTTKASLDGGCFCFGAQLMSILET